MIQKSFQNLYKNPVLFVPDLIYAIISFFLIYMLYSVTGFNTILASLPEGFEAQVELFQTFFASNMGQILVSVAIFAIVTFFIGVTALTTKFILMRYIVNRKRIDLYSAWQKGNRYFWKVVLLRVYVYIISIVVLLLVSLVSGLVYMLINPFNPELASYFSILLAGLLGVVALLLLSWTLLYRYPLMFLTKKSKACTVLKNSFKYFKQKSGYVVISWLVIFCVTVAFILAGILLNAIYSGAVQSLDANYLLVFVGVVWTLFMTIFDLVPKLWKSLYLFGKFKDKPLRNL
tara:strand:+ start:719 stop:1585 length:867 start_codon:yes stop_codon:yes gene_type:complete